jgi:hypothetical protein
VQDVGKDGTTVLLRRYETVQDVGTTLQVVTETVADVVRTLTRRCKIIAGLATTLECGL